MLWVNTRTSTVYILFVRAGHAEFFWLRDNDNATMYCLELQGHDKIGNIFSVSKCSSHNGKRNSTITNNCVTFSHQYCRMPSSTVRCKYFISNGKKHPPLPLRVLSAPHMGNSRSLKHNKISLVKVTFKCS